MCVCACVYIFVHAYTRTAAVMRWSQAQPRYLQQQQVDTPERENQWKTIRKQRPHPSRRHNAGAQRVPR